VALANGTVALECALKALGVGQEMKWLRPVELYCLRELRVMLGARPVFADVDRESQNITAESIRNVLTSRTRLSLQCT